MPELPEVETVRRTLENEIIGKKITEVSVYYANMIEGINVSDFIKLLKNQIITNMKRRGKWLIFETTDYYLLSHLRMEGKYLWRNGTEKLEKHEHVSFMFDDNTELRYRDTRKFGKMYLFDKDKALINKPLSELGLEPFDNDLDIDYLKQKYKNKNIPIKTSLLDQGIIVGIGNIYADEILFLSKINPFIKTKDLKDKDLKNIIKYTKEVLNKAIDEGGTTIRSYTSSEGVHGRFQQSLLVHGKENEKCVVCQTTILKTKIGGRGTYYCEKCQNID